MIINFVRSEIQRLVDHTTSQKEHKALYEQPETAKPGLWLVGDQGVYLMSNGKERLLAKTADEPGQEESSFVAYAVEVHPNKLAFDDWWGNKRASFGGDDGVEFIPFEGDATRPGIKEWLAGSSGEFLQMDLTPQNYTLVMPEAAFVLEEPLVGAVRKAAGDKAQALFLKGLGWKYCDVPVRKMDREGLIIYIGGLKTLQEQEERKLKFANASIQVYERTIAELNKKVKQYEKSSGAKGGGEGKPKAKKSAAKVPKRQKGKR